MSRINFVILNVCVISRLLFGSDLAYSGQIFQGGFESGNFNKTVGNAAWHGGAYQDITDTIAHSGKYSVR